MRSIRLAFITFVACLPFTVAHAHPETSRQQVLDDLARARASGDVEVAGELGGLARERRPDLFGAAPAAPLARGATRAELLVASRRGDVPHGEVEWTAGRSPALALATQELAPARTRAQVRDELAEAIRDGDIEEFGDGGRQLRDIHRGRYTDMLMGVSAPRYALAG